MEVEELDSKPAINSDYIVFLFLKNNTKMLYHIESDEEYSKIKQFLATNPALPGGLTPDDILNPENP
jgi:hypothetical protein